MTKPTEQEQVYAHYQKGQLYCPNVYTWCIFFYEDFPSTDNGRSKGMTYALQQSRLHTSTTNALFDKSTTIRNSGVQAMVIEPFNPFLVLDISIMPIPVLRFKDVPDQELMGKIVLRVLYKNKIGYLASEVISYPDEEDPRQGYRTLDPYMEKWLGTDHEKLTSHL